MSRLNPGRTYPQFSQAACGSLALLQRGQSTNAGGVMAWCDRRVRVRAREVFLFGCMIYLSEKTRLAE